MPALPRFWLMVLLLNSCSITALSQENNKHLIFPDNSTYQEWEQRIAELKKIVPTYESDRVAPLLYYIGCFYDSLENRELAKHFFRAAIYSDTLDHRLAKRSAAIYLGNLFNKEKQFDSALYYLRITEQLNIRGITCANFMPFFRAEFNATRMMALYGKGEIDSAIKCLLPYAFEEGGNCQWLPEGLHSREGDYHCNVLLWVNILKRKYGSVYVDEQLRQLVNSADVKLVSYKSPLGDYLRLEVWVNFMGSKHLAYSYETWPPGSPYYIKIDLSGERKRFQEILSRTMLFQLATEANY